MTTNGWNCRRCAAPDVVSNGAVWVAGSYRNPVSPEVKCEGCGAPVPEDVRSLLASEAAQRAAEAVLAAVRERGPGVGGRTPSSRERRAAGSAPIQPGALYSLREVAPLLRMDRSGTLRAAIDAGLIRTVRVGPAERVSGAEILRITRDGLPALPGGRRAPTQRPAKRRRASRNTGAAASIAKIPL